MQPGRQSRELAEPYSLQWFLEAERFRYGRRGRWLPRLLEFGKHSGETLLGLGDGLGADWVQYARGGAEVTACSTSVETLALVRRNFESARFDRPIRTCRPRQVANGVGVD